MIDKYTYSTSIVFRVGLPATGSLLWALTHILVNVQNHTFALPTTLVSDLESRWNVEMKFGT